jgi:hypothetical protein
VLFGSKTVATGQSAEVSGPGDSEEFPRKSKT